MNRQQRDKENKCQIKFLHRHQADKQLPLFQMIDHLHGKELKQGGQTGNGSQHARLRIGKAHGEHERDEEGAARQLNDGLRSSVADDITSAAFFIIRLAFRQRHKESLSKTS